jgi:hypothetical protein
MSYDLHAVRVAAGATIEEALEAEEHDDDAPPTAAERAEMERLADALMALDPAAERHDGETFIEIDTPSMQIGVYARSAGITVPYWFDGGQADAVMTRAYEYAAVLAESGGYTVFDPQIDEVVAGAPPEASARIMAQTARSLHGATTEEGAARAPRWKFWKRG